MSSGARGVLLVSLGCASACGAISGLDQLEFNREGGSDGEVANCVGLDDICGPAQNEPCCASPVVPGGTYSRSGGGSSLATVSDFRLDRFEVTVGRFRRFVEVYAEGGKPKPGDGANPHLTTPSSGWDDAWDSYWPADAAALMANLKCENGPTGAQLPAPMMKYTWTDRAGENEHLPINCVSWYEAFAFCAWDGGRLPTAAEWGRAATGDDYGTQRSYPWGDAVPTDTTFAAFNCVGEEGTVIDGCEPSRAPQPVGHASPKGDGAWGHADLAGNMFELNLDYYVNPGPEPCDDCATLEAPSMDAQQVIRGGSWYDPQFLLPSTFWPPNGGARDSRSITVGFRCARSP